MQKSSYQLDRKLAYWKNQVTEFGVNPIKLKNERKESLGREITKEEEIKAIQEMIAILVG